MLRHRGSRRPHPAGFSLIELMVTLTILTLLLLAAAPSYSEWLANGRVRSVAEEIANGLRMAQAEAMRRNRVVVFVQTAAKPALSASPSSSGTSWYVQALPMTSSASNISASSTDYIQGGSYASAGNVAVTGTSSVLCFGPLGNLVDVTATAANNVIGTACTSSAQTLTVSHTSASRSLKVLVGIGGQVRMCDPGKTLSTINPDGCPNT